MIKEVLTLNFEKQCQKEKKKTNSSKLEFDSYPNLIYIQIYIVTNYIYIYI